MSVEQKPRYEARRNAQGHFPNRSMGGFAINKTPRYGHRGGSRFFGLPNAFTLGNEKRPAACLAAPTKAIVGGDTRLRYRLPRWPHKAPNKFDGTNTEVVCPGS
jgi:hypothetical protein